MKELPVRKNIRLSDYDYSKEGYYFITVCIKDKQKLLGKVAGDAVLGAPVVQLSDSGKIVQEYLQKMNDILESAALENYIIMPNHVHLLVALDECMQDCGPLRAAPPANHLAKAMVPRIVHGMKTVVTKQIGYSIWQRSYHDHIIRNEADYRRIWRYIDENPAKWADGCYYTV